MIQVVNYSFFSMIQVKYRFFFNVEPFLTHVHFLETSKFGHSRSFSTSSLVKPTERSISLSFQFCHDSVKSVVFILTGLLILYWARLIVWQKYVCMSYIVFQIESWSWVRGLCREPQEPTSQGPHVYRARLTNPGHVPVSFWHDS